jgi:hypothetical protein
MPESISVNNDAFGNFIKVASLSAKERRSLFSKQSNEQKASFIKVNLALQFIKRANMTKEQQEFVADAISKVSADIYDKSDSEKVSRSEQKGLEMENKALGLFARNDLGDFIEPLMTNKDEEVALLQKYENLLKNGMKARKKIVREMSVNDRVNIWKTQLVYHLTTANLSKAQSELILNFLTTLSSATFEHPVNETKEESAKALEILDKKIQSVFSKAEEFAIFEEIGIQKIAPDRKETIALLPLSFNRMVNLPVSFTKETTASLPRETLCDCRWSCSGNQTCGAGVCDTADRECGPFGTWFCTYKCGTPAIE